jgi:hypothetical protein
VRAREEKPSKKQLKLSCHPERRGTRLKHLPGLVLDRCPTLQREQATYTHCYLQRRIKVEGTWEVLCKQGMVWVRHWNEQLETVETSEHETSNDELAE